MRKVIALTLMIGVAALAGGVAGASGVADVDTASATPSGVKYEWFGNEGELSIVGAPGSRYVVYDSLGTPVAGGELDQKLVSFVAGNSGVGPDGVIVFVVVEDDVVAVTDPDWSW
ncbi:MAG: hypothetical protein QNJ90_10235 [Planctomycetota bacterium]|nr:hypothetical protein [Planctomycetota bacterium]